jgi:hypothetical protein
MNKNLLSVCLFIFFFIRHLNWGIQEEKIFKLTSEDAYQMGMQIWKNECGGKLEGLTSWNQGEEFASLGIGHFIWYPAGVQGPFKEMFPALLNYFQKHEIVLPDWLKTVSGCPWRSRRDFLEAQKSEKMEELRQLLIHHIDLQVCFMVERLHYALPILLKHVELASRDHITTQFHRLAQTPNGLFVLLDYLNFKGEGISFQESYQGQGWGLLQVLERMRGCEQGEAAIKAFIIEAKEVLRIRVQNSPTARGEQRWLKGWYNRIDSYLK